MKIIFGKLGHETNTFSVEKGTFEYWTRAGWHEGQDLIDACRNGSDYTTGMLRAAEERGVELVPTIAVLDAGPLVTKEALEKVLGTMLKYIEENKEGVDGLCLGLHGAGCAEGVSDLETYTLEKVREIVGPDMPIMITLDLHANISKPMLDNTMAMFGIKEYPHIDCAEAGYLAMNCLVDHLEKGRKFYQSYVSLPILIPCAEGSTFSEPMKSVKEMAAAYKKDHGLVDVTVFHGFPYSDLYYTGLSVVTVSDMSQDEADKAAKEIARTLWHDREKLIYKPVSAHEGVNKAAEILKEKRPEGERGYVVLSESSDNPGGGATNDATGLLWEFLVRQEFHTILGYIHDPEVALAAHNAGVGNYISCYIGAKKDDQHGKPILLENAYVAALSDGEAVHNSTVALNRKIHYGKSARLVIGNCEVVVTEKQAQQTLDDATFTMVGADLTRYDIIGVKSSNHFRAWFEPRAIAVMPIDEAGIQTADLKTLRYKNIRRPIIPLDENVEFEI